MEELAADMDKLEERCTALGTVNPVKLEKLNKVCRPFGSHSIPPESSGEVVIRTPGHDVGPGRPPGEDQERERV